MKTVYDILNEAQERFDEIFRGKGDEEYYRKEIKKIFDELEKYELENDYDVRGKEIAEKKILELLRKRN